jgi:hypothetical protein
VTDQGFRFCPRCGTALVEGLPYCPKCGFNVAELAPGSRPAATDREPDPYDWGAGGRGFERSVGSESHEPATSNEPPGRPIVTELRPRGSRGSSILLAGLAVAVGLIAYALITRPDTAITPSAAPVGGSGAPASLVPGATQAPSAPIVGLTIHSPRDGDAVATGEVTVIGLAPPGLSITRDVSFGLDQHTTVDGTGHWAIGVRLDPGENTLVFRIGDDRSTEQRIRVTFQPPA